MSVSDDIPEGLQSLVREQVETELAKERERYEQLYRRQAALAEITLAMNQPYQLQSTLALIAEVTTAHLPATGGSSVVIWDAETEKFSVSASTVPKQPQQTTANRVRRKGGASRWIIDNQKPCIVTDIREDPFTANTMLPEFGLQAYAGVPLLGDGKVLGVLYALDHHIREYTEDDLEFLTALASRASLAITKVRLFERLQVTNVKLGQEVNEKAILIHELEEALAKIKTLHGLIPICAGCKNIRNDEGFWQNVEIYIESRSEAEFSHGICPECVPKLYPGLFDDDE